MRSCPGCKKFDTLKTVYERVPKVVPLYGDQDLEFTKTVYQFVAIGSKCSHCNHVEWFKDLDNNFKPIN